MGTLNCVHDFKHPAHQKRNKLSMPAPGLCLFITVSVTDLRSWKMLLIVQMTKIEHEYLDIYIIHKFIYDISRCVQHMYTLGEEDICQFGGLAAHSPTVWSRWQEGKEIVTEVCFMSIANWCTPFRPLLQSVWEHCVDDVFGGFHHPPVR